jgi:amidophosphoribosyltransferase
MCGIFGVIGTRDIRAELLDGIALLTHRGQEAAGVLICNPETDQHHLIKRKGGISNLPIDQIAEHQGTMGIAHLRYATTGGSSEINAQPFWTDNGNIGFVHNGQVENMQALKDILQQQGRQLESTSDGEMLLKLFAQNRLSQEIFAAIEKLHTQASGGYACLFVIPEGLLAIRDPHGIRPLIMGQKITQENVITAFSSESVALELNDYKIIGDLKPGEAVLVKKDMSIQREVLDQRAVANCAFEYLYFADASSVIDGSAVNDVRYRMGKQLAKRCEHLLDRIDIVTPIPETPRPIAGGFCDATGKPYKDIIAKSRHVKRIFITPGQEERERKAQQGFRYQRGAFIGKRILLVDDSIVRGTNMREIVRKVRELGAKEVHVGVGWPKVIHPCPYGIDMPTLLLAAGKTNDQICEYLGADTVTYIEPEDLYEVVGRKTLCAGCVTGTYPTRKLPV